jgi:hypothetical protein
MFRRRRLILLMLAVMGPWPLVADAEQPEIRSPWEVLLRRVRHRPVPVRLALAARL